MELDQVTYDEILNLCQVGDEFVEAGQYDQGIIKYKEALQLIPEPRNQWEATTWVCAAMGDACYMKKEYKRAKKYFIEALNYRGGMTNAFVLMRVGQCHYHLEDVEKAKKYFQRAYELEGKELFEEEDTIYLKLITTK